MLNNWLQVGYERISIVVIRLYEGRIISAREAMR